MTTTIGGSYPAVNSDSDATINGLTVGKGGGSVSNNTALGYQAGYSNTSGARNTFAGYGAGYSNTTGLANTFVGGPDATGGYSAGYSNTSGSYNVALGDGSLGANTTASNNTAIGYQAGYANTTGTLLTAVGQGAAYHNTTGANITAIGSGALTTNTTGSYNTAVGTQDSTGYSALGANSTGSYNISVGNGALGNNTTASNNTAVGYQAGYTTTTGAYNTFVGGQAGYSSNAANAGNTCVGWQAGYSLTTGTSNTFVGANGQAATAGSGYYITTGSNNTILGAYDGNQGGLDIRTASNYIVLSDGAGNPRQVIDGSGNSTVGTYSATYQSAGVGFKCGPTIGAWLVQSGTDAFSYYQTSVGYKFYVNNAGTISSTNGSINVISDQRLKENIRDLDDGLDKIMSLKPRKFDWKENKGANIKNERGFIAQEFETVFPDLIGTWNDKAPEGEEPYKSVRADLIPVLVKAIQELKAEFDAYKATHP